MRVKQILYSIVALLLFMSVIALMTACADNDIEEGEQDDFINEKIIITVTTPNITPTMFILSLRKLQRWGGHVS